MKNENWFVMPLLLAPFACGGSQDDAAFEEEQVELGVAQQALSVSGTLKYLNRWDPTFSGSASNFRFQSYNNTVQPLTAVRFCLRSAAPVVETCTFTNNVTGAYSLTVNAGSYTPRVYWVTGDSRFKLTNNAGTVDSFDDDSRTVLVTGATLNLSIGGSEWPDNSDVLRASTYAAARVWFDTMGSVHNLNNLTPEWNTMGTIQIRDSAVTSAGQTTIEVNHLSNPTLNIMWHELGHTLEKNLHVQKFGSGKGWPAFTPYAGTPVSNCKGPSGQTQNSSADILKEAFADFIMNIVEFNTPNVGGTRTCRSGSSTCGVANISTANGPAVPSCGAGSPLRSKAIVTQALVDLIDTENVAPLGTCLPDAVQLSIGQVVNAMRDTPFNQAQTGQTFGNSTIAVDETSLLDLLRTVRVQTGVSMYNIWADSCFQPGLASGPLN